MLLVRSETTQIGFQAFFDYLCLTISLRMINCTDLEMCSLEFERFLPKFYVKVGSRPNIIEVSMPCTLNIWSMRICANNVRVNGWGRAQKWEYLESLSTTTMITDLFLDVGRPVMKSMDMSIHTDAKRGKGCKVPSCLIFSPLLRWNTSHLEKKVRMSFFMLVQK